MERPGHTILRLEEEIERLKQALGSIREYYWKAPPNLPAETVASEMEKIANNAINEGPSRAIS